VRRFATTVEVRAPHGVRPPRTRTAASVVPLSMTRKLLIAAAIVVLAASCAGIGDRASGRDRSPSGSAARERPAPCAARGEWMVTRNAAWIRRAAELAGFHRAGCTGSAWVMRRRTSVFLWTTSGSGGDGTTMPTIAGLAWAGVRGDGVRLMWRVQGVSVWLEPGPRADQPFPQRRALVRLIVATQRLPRRARPIAMMPTPYGPLPRCRHDVLVRPACPTRIPRVPGWNLYGDDLEGVFGLERGGEVPGAPELNRPPAMLHIEIWAGRPGRVNVVTADEWPTGPPVHARDGLVRRARQRPLPLGSARWGGRSGSLALIPGYPVGGSMGDHLVFRWREDGYEYLVSLHAWEPFHETVAMLRRIVESIPR
jgi:hypothetical protein